ncbi:hypothetical protein MKW94_016356 [Papaver nudicaule]|uniref:DUF7804 domain-containing protein n=1 Tax=Papaver nudicaule TaxID=74823 RepID=A0AA41SBY8_PAPNU|nr:hypothetical protein [Papaver nudicaule]
MTSSSTLGMQCDNTFGFLKATSFETRLRWLTEAQSRAVLKSKKLQFNTQVWSISKIGRSKTRAAVSSSSIAYLDTVLGTDLELVFSKREKQQRWDNAVKKIKVENGREQVPTIAAEKLDEWLTYIFSTVKNIEEAPLLVHIYSSKDKGGISPVESQPTIPIPIIEKRKEGSPVPDGIILVEQLNVDNDQYNDTVDEIPSIMTNCSSSTKTWGVVIQGRGADSASSCYSQDMSSRVVIKILHSLLLVKATCFGEIADLQLKNSWLLRQLIN